MNSDRPYTQIIWLDIARSLAIFLVVLTHSVEAIYSLNIDFFINSNSYSVITAFMLFTIGRLGVPIFLFISGYLLLSRTYDDQKCHIFWKKNCLRLLITTEIWIVLYNIFLHVNGMQAFSITDVVKQLLFVKQTNMSHMWYMPMILGMYVLIPFAANALHSVQTSTVFYATALYMVIAAIFPIFDILSKSCGYGDFYSILSTGFSGGEYGIYLLLGFLCHKGVLKKVRSYVLCILGMVCFILTFLLQMFAYSHQYPYNVWYNCGLLMLFVFLNYFHVFRADIFPAFRAQ